MDFKTENGRRYHAYKEGTYYIPNDEKEADRLDLQHHLWRMTLDGALYLAPIPNKLGSVLDLGCGTGIWSIEFAQEHPSASVIGVDLSPVQPSWVPPNCKFQVDDVESDWAYNITFDFIHCRFLGMGIKNWKGLFEQSFANLNPGGWIELQEFTFWIVTEENSPKPNELMTKFNTDMLTAAQKIGVHPRQSEHFGPVLEEAGFVNVQCKRLHWPLGEWSENPRDKQIGLWAKTNMAAGLDAISLKLFTNILGMSREEAELRTAQVKQELVDPDIRQRINLYIWTAQRPERKHEIG